MQNINSIFKREFINLFILKLDENTNPTPNSMKAQRKFDYLKVNYKLSSLTGTNDADRYVNEYNLEIYGMKYDDYAENDSCHEKSVFIGKAKIELYLLGLAQTHRFSRYELFDSHSISRRDFFNGIYNFEKHKFKKKIEELLDESFNANLLNIDRVEILPEFRGHGYGKEVIKDIILRFYSSFGLAVLKAFPLQLEAKIGPDEWGEKMKYSEMEQNPTKAKKSLYDFYRSMGFENILKGEYFFLSPIFRNDFFDSANNEEE